jgi:hypothetical protein
MSAAITTYICAFIPVFLGAAVFTVFQTEP